MTTTEPSLSLEIDQDAGAAYLQFSDSDVARSVEFSDHIIVDLDVHNMVIGIEILDLAKSVPLDDLTERFHVRAESFALLMQALRSSSRASSAATGTRRLAPTKRNLTLA
ncbi:DUF2283 domain-containing protein [Amycolatopsis orientalis]|uniref:DUF2283 domain-containing protein n=1 Tax=Amycolatopsis orientalis TaxID=31958 RepID=UPI0006860989|nr:DUF2283 domain-containing protein [Amycolatopsis orientalis]